MTVEDDGCPITARQVVGFNIIVQTGEILPTNEIKICPISTQNIQMRATTPNTGGSYTWTPSTGLSSTNTRTTSASVDSALTYTVTYQPTFGCPIIEPFEIIPEGELTLDTDSVKICLGESVQLNVDFTLNGPPVPITYTWDPITSLSDPTIPNPVASPTTTTTYSITASTLTCDFEAFVQVVVEEAPQLDPFTDPMICTGDSVQITAAGINLGTADFSWTPVLGLSASNVPNPVVYPGSTTTYQVVATNSCGTDNQPVTVNVAPPLNVSSSFTDVSCTGGTDGEINIVSTGGAGTGLNYTWTPNIGTGPTVNNLGAGSYTVVVTDASNCVDTAVTIISEPPPLVLNLVDSTHILCTGEFTGSITVAASGGTPDYLYSIDGSNWLSSPTFIDLPAGTYSISSQDANGCIASLPPLTLTEPTLPVLGISGFQTEHGL